MFSCWSYIWTTIRWLTLACLKFPLTNLATFELLSHLCVHAGSTNTTCKMIKDHKILGYCATMRPIK
jgi:hypothetical protein